jgi:serine/threonine protein kinase
MNERPLTESRAEAPPQISRGATIGRYVVVGYVGHGAMGDVYSAFDPDLNRKLAIKLLRVRRGSGVGAVDGRTRLLREAQAIAKLSHPNVVVVHDVGNFEDRVFIAMEFIEGGTLSYWLHQQSRSWRDILTVFLAAGRGLQHAHEANLVHRDFKPDNVMVRLDGEVRVMDFGLVRYIDLGDDEQKAEGQPGNTPVSDPAARQASMLESTVNLERSTAAQLPAAVSPQTKLTQTGAMLGTPAYMAPEQFIGQPTDARSDQFSFCIALYESLFGVRPFDGTTMAELTGNVLAGQVKPPPQRSPVPAGISRALRRGLSVSPADRYPSMTELLADLSRSAQPRKTILLVTAAAGFALLVALVSGLQHNSNGPSLCAVPTQRFEGVWESPGRDASRRSAIELGFRTRGSNTGVTTSTGRSSSWGWADHRSRASFTAISRGLDKYVADWSGIYKDACDATNYRRTQSTQVLDLRMSCLTDRFNELRALSDMLLVPSTEMINDPNVALAFLGSLDRCSNVQLLRGASPPSRSSQSR